MKILLSCLRRFLPFLLCVIENKSSAVVVVGKVITGLMLMWWWTVEHKVKRWWLATHVWAHLNIFYRKRKKIQRCKERLYAFPLMKSGWKVLLSLFMYMTSSVFFVLKMVCIQMNGLYFSVCHPIRNEALRKLIFLLK